MKIVKRQFIIGHDIEVVEELCDNRPNGYGLRLTSPHKLGSLLKRVDSDVESLKSKLAELEAYKGRILRIKEEYPELFV